MRTTLRVLVILVLAFNTLFIVSTRIGVGGFRSFRIESNTMEPAIKPGELVVTVTHEKYKKNDIVVISSGNSYYTNRISSIDDYLVITKGDSSSVEFEPRNINDIVGKVEYVITKPVVIISFVFDLALISLLIYDAFKK